MSYSSECPRCGHNHIFPDDIAYCREYFIKKSQKSGVFDGTPKKETK